MSSDPKIFHFSCAEGEQFGVTITLSDSDGNPLDLNEYDVIWILGTTEKEVGQGIVIDDPSSGSLVLEVTESDTAEEGLVRHELRVFENETGGLIDTVVVGTMGVGDSLFGGSQ